MSQDNPKRRVEDHPSPGEALQGVDTSVDIMVPYDQPGVYVSAAGLGNYFRRQGEVEKMYRTLIADCPRCTAALAVLVEAEKAKRIG